MKKIFALILALVMLLSLTGCEEILGIVLDVGLGYLETMDTTQPTTQPEETPGQTTEKPTEPEPTPQTPTTQAPTEAPIDEDGWYYSNEDVALYN